MVLGSIFDKVTFTAFSTAFRFPLTGILSVKTITSVYCDSEYCFKT